MNKKTNNTIKSFQRKAYCDYIYKSKRSKKENKMTNKTIINTRVIDSKKALQAHKNNIQFTIDSRTHNCAITNKLNNKQVSIDSKSINQLVNTVKRLKDRIQILSACKDVYKKYAVLNKLEVDAKAKKLHKCVNTAYDSIYAFVSVIQQLANNNVNVQVYNKVEAVKTIAKALHKAKSKVKASKLSAVKA